VLEVYQFGSSSSNALKHYGGGIWMRQSGSILRIMCFVLRVGWRACVRGSWTLEHRRSESWRIVEQLTCYNGGHHNDTDLVGICWDMYCCCDC
jgi:hypothetical protein